MKTNTFVFFLGTAGAGKSTMTNAFQCWMFTQGYDAVTVNLDPGAINDPYTADVDIRDWVRLEEVMDKYNLGPNGAQITSADLMYLHLDDIRQSLEGFQTDYFLVDTPGQIELFIHRETSREIIQALSLEGAVVVYLFDPLLARTPSGMVSQLSLATSVKYRLELPFIQILNKVDILEDEELERIMKWAKPDNLYSELISVHGSMSNEHGVEILRALESTGEAARLIPCSATTMEGMEDIYSAVQALIMGGEDIDQG